MKAFQYRDILFSVILVLSLPGCKIEARNPDIHQQKQIIQVLDGPDDELPVPFPGAVLGASDFGLTVSTGDGHGEVDLRILLETDKLALIEEVDVEVTLGGMAASCGSGIHVGSLDRL